jgi:CubicO group peptidase (beta-lactamase class C family)
MYSNLGYALAGAMAEAATDTPWEALIAQEVLDPLSLTTAGFGAPTGDTAPWGHNFVGSVPPDPAADNPPAISPAGTLHMALVDQARVLRAHLTDGETLPGYLSADSWTRLHTPGPNDYAMGWIQVERDWSNGPFLTHDGSNTMWYARAVVAPGIDRALVVVTNQGPPNGQAAVQEAEKQLRTMALE